MEPIRESPRPERGSPTEPYGQEKQPFRPVERRTPERPIAAHSAPVRLAEMRHPGLTPVKEKPLTPVKTAEPEKINTKINDPPQNDKKTLIFSPAPAAKKLPKKMQFHGKKGRQRTEAEVRDLLTFVQARNGVWPNDNYVSEQMRRYYRREYPEYFRKARKSKKVQSHGLAPIDLQSRRTGTTL